MAGNLTAFLSGGLGEIQQQRQQAGAFQQAILGQIIQQQIQSQIAAQSPEAQLQQQLLNRFFPQVGQAGQAGQGGLQQGGLQLGGLPQGGLPSAGGAQLTQAPSFPPGTTLNIGGLNLPLVPKKSAAQEKREVEASELSQGLQTLLNSFGRAKAEAKAQIPGFGARGPLGRLAGSAASLTGRLGLSPAVSVFDAQRDAFATTVAKAAGEVRPTDEDIRRFVKTLPSTARTDEENALIVQDIRNKILQGNAGELWKQGAATPAISAFNTLTTPSGIPFTFKRKGE